MKQEKFKQTEIGIIPEDWEIKELEQISNVIDSLHQTPDYTTFGIPMVRAADIKAGNLKLEKALRVTPKIYEEFTRNYKPKKNDIVMSRVGTYFVTSFVDTDESFCLGQNTATIHPRINSYFVYFALNSKFVKDQIEQRLVGSGGQKTLSLKNIKELLIPKPTDEVEIDKIGKMLSTLHSKIELNQQMNRTLEATGQAIFKHWFIDFEFPNEEGKPYKSSDGEMVYNGELPNGWEHGKLGDALSLLKDGSHNPPKRVDSGIRFIAGASDLKHFEVDFDNCSYISKEDYDHIHKYWEIQPNDILLTIVGTIGNVAMVKKKDLPFSMQRSIAILRSNDKLSQYFLYFLLNTNMFKQFLNSHVNPTAQPGIYLGTLSTAPIVIPKKETLEQFDKLAESIIIRMQHNSNEIQNLSQIRDSLLPKLMSGKIRVPIGVA